MKTIIIVLIVVAVLVGGYVYMSGSGIGEQQSSTIAPPNLPE